MKAYVMMGLLVLAGAALPATMAFAQSGDAQYCAALVQKYEQYLATPSSRAAPPQGLDARIAAEKCKAGDLSGIPALEKALKNARFDLPART